MAINRRQFLKRTGIATAGALFGPSLFGNPFVRRAMAQTIGNRYLILLYLDGGNDGLNTVVPMSDATGALRAAYEVARLTGDGGLQLTIPDLTPTAIGTCPVTNTALGLHPGLIGLKNLQTDYNSVAVIQNCGYPNPNLSHEESKNIWQTASPLGPSNTGWIGGHLAGAGGYGSADIPGVCISSQVGLDFQQTGTNVLAVSDLQNFRFPYKSNANSAERFALKTAYQAMYGPAASSLQSIQSHVGTVGSVTLDAADNYPPLADAWDTGRASTIVDGYDALTNAGNGTADRLRDISRIIYGVENGATGIASRFFRLGADGGFDTHSDQGAATGYHYDLHRNWGDAVEWFYRDMVDLGIADRVLIMVWSEFSRRVEQNDTGTDHGSQGPMFVVGGSVNGGVYGSHPDINLGALEDGNTVYSQAAGDYRSTDFRDVYGTILEQWVNMAHGDVQAMLPIDPIADPVNYWRTQNFNMGFV